MFGETSSEIEKNRQDSPSTENLPEWHPTSGQAPIHRRSSSKNIQEVLVKFVLVKFDLNFDLKNGRNQLPIWYLFFWTESRAMS
jgi:hypothetical protein